MGDDREPMEPSPRRGDTIRKRASRTDSKPRLVATARFIRELLPGDEAGEAPSAGGSAVSQRIGRLVSELQPERPSALRELGLGALQAWQALSEAQGRGRGKVDVAILFTDLVGFSSWALHAGDEAALELLRRVATAEDGAISAHSGTLVKRLGDGAMAVFRDASQAISAALEAQRGIERIDVDGYSPRVRAGVHVGRPRRVGRDYLGVDVNIAARIVEAAKGGEVLVSGPAREGLQAGGFEFGHSRRLRAAGAPRDLTVCRVSSG